MSEYIEDDLPLPSFNEIFGEIVKDLDIRTNKVNKDINIDNNGNKTDFITNNSNNSDNTNNTSNNTNYTLNLFDSNVIYNANNINNNIDDNINKYINGHVNNNLNYQMINNHNSNTTNNIINGNRLSEDFGLNNQLTSIENTSSDNENISSNNVKKRSKRDSDDNVAGRWTSEEHRLFLQGIMLYGRDWKRIQPMIGTRSLVQIRTHAQKVFKKIGIKQFNSFSNINGNILTQQNATNNIFRDNLDAMSINNNITSRSGNNS